MVRNYKRKKPARYTEGQKKLAVEHVQNGASYREASEMFNVPITTIHDCLRDKYPGSVGHPTVLSQQEELVIVMAFLYFAENGWPCDRRDLRNIVSEYCELNHRGVPWNDTPGQGFLSNFEKRWANVISKRKPELLTVARVRSMNEETLSMFFSKLTSLYQKFGLEGHPERVLNTDEVGFNTNSDEKECFFKKGSKDAYILAPSCGKSMFSVLMCSSAAGEVMPPLVIYKGSHLFDTWCQGGPRDTQYSVTKSGWMEMAVFEAWFEKV